MCVCVASTYCRLQKEEEKEEQLLTAKVCMQEKLYGGMGNQLTLGRQSSVEIYQSNSNWIGRG